MDTSGALSHLSHIVIEGPIGVGKTSLARRLAKSIGADLLLEKADENPFLSRFYKDPKNGALPAQLFFLMQRARQMQEILQGDMFKPVRIADFLMEKDRLFAGITLDSDEINLYKQVYDNLTLHFPTPDLVVYLQAPLEILLERIKRRNISYEQIIDIDYLQKVVDAYADFFYHYYEAPLLIVNASEIDLVNSDHDYDQLMQQICEVRSGRHFFNPMPLALYR